MKSNKYIWFSLCLTYVQFYILHPKLYTFGFILNQNAFLIVRRGENWHSLTDRLVQLPNWRTSPTWDTLGHGRAQVVPGRSSVTLSLCPHWSQDVVDIGPTLKIQQPAVTSGTRALTFIWEEWRYVEVQLREKLTLWRTHVQPADMLLSTSKP